MTETDIEEGSFALSIAKLWHAAWKNRLLVVAVTAVVGIGVAFYTLGQTKIYRASATLQIDPNPPRPLGKEVQTVVDVGSGTFWANREYYKTQFSIIRSRRVAAETARSLGLHRDARFLANLPPSQPAPAQTVSVEEAAAAVLARLEVQPVKDSRLVVVTFDDADPARAQRVLSALVDVYVAQNIDDALKSTGSAGEWLNGQLQKLKNELENNEMALHDYKKKKRILSVSIDDQSNMLREEMRQLNEALTAVRARREHIIARQTELAKVDANDPVHLPATELLDNGLLRELRQDYITAKGTHSSLLGAGKGANHPDVKAAASRIETSRRALLAEVRNIMAAVKGDLAAATREVNGLSGLFQSARQRAMDLNLLEIEYRRLERSKNNTEKLHSLVLERAKESDITRLMRFNNIQVTESAFVPDRPVRPQVPINLAFGFLSGLVLGLGLALGKELLDRSVRGPEDVESGLGLPYLGLLPIVNRSRHQAAYGATERRRRRVRSAENGDGSPELVVHEQSSSAAAEAARSIRTSILFMSPDAPFRRLLITSAAPAEGKTTVASAVAIAMAQAGQRVLLIDCDLRKPRLHRVFNQTNDVGITSAVLDRSILQERKFDTQVPNLSVLAAGPRVPNPSELLQSDSFGETLDVLQQDFDRVILDSPPVGAVADAAILSTRVDATVLVIAAHKTSRDLVHRSAQRLADVGGRVAGCVLNRVDQRRRDYYYYQYYRYYGRHETGEASPSQYSKPRAGPG